MNEKTKNDIIDNVVKKVSKDFSLDTILKQNQDRVIAIGKKPFKSKIIDFPTLRQAYSYSCGASAIQVMLLYYGIDMREGQIIKKVGTTAEEGTERENMVAYLKSFGFKIEEGQKYTIDDLKEYVDKNLPVIIAIQAWVDTPTPGWEKGWENGHYVVVMGYTDDHIIFSDPSSVYDTYLTYKELEDRWHDVGMTPDDKLDHYAMIPYGKVPDFHSNLFIHMD